MIRTGNITASRIKDVLTNGRGRDTWGKTALSYAYELALQRMGVHVDRFTSKAMQWGLDHEEEAIAALEEEMGITIGRSQQSITHPDLPFFSCTPDGLIEAHTVVEVKCPNALNHYEDTLSDERLRDEYYPQVQAQISIIGAERAYIASFDPTFPRKRLVVYTWERDQPYIDGMLERVKAFEQLVRSVQL